MRMKKNIGLKKIYNSTFQKKKRVRETDEFKEVLKIVQWSGKKVLDVGCGTGELAFLISKKGAKVKGIDYSEEGIDIAKKKYRHSNLSYELVDVSKKISGKYDVIVSIGTLEHMDKPGPWSEEDDKIHTIGGLSNDKERHHHLFEYAIKRYKQFDKRRNTNLLDVYPEFEAYY